MKNNRFFSKLPIIFLVLATTVFITFQITYITVNDNWKARVSDMIMTDRTAISQSITELDNVVSHNSVCTYDTNNLVHGALSGYLDGTNDRFSQFLTAEMYNDYKIGASQATSIGIGISALFDNGYFSSTSSATSCPKFLLKLSSNRIECALSFFAITFSSTVFNRIYVLVIYIIPYHLRISNNFPNKILDP